MWGEIETVPCSPGYLSNGYVAEDALEFLVLLFLPPECWHHRRASPYPALIEDVTQAITGAEERMLERPGTGKDAGASSDFDEQTPPHSLLFLVAVLFLSLAHFFTMLKIYFLFLCMHMSM